MPEPLFTLDRPARAALFLSGTGTNAEVLLQSRLPHLEIVVLVTDAPATSRAPELAARFHLPLAALDIRRFYREQGLDSISLATAAGRRVRELWTRELSEQILPHRPDCGLLAGFVPLTNLTGRFPCLNVHPGDLTLEQGGRRLLAGLHWKPVELAIVSGQPTLRSSVILAQPYTGNGQAEMDSGPVLGVSEPVPVELLGHSLAELREIWTNRQPGAAEDLLRKVARHNLERLKTDGDHRVFPAAAEAFAAGRYAVEAEQLFFCEGGRWLPVRSVEFGRRGCRPLPLSPDGV